MRLSVSILLTTVICFYCSQNVTAQRNINETEISEETELNIPPLDVIIDFALEKSARLKSRKSQIGVKKSTLASERIYWTRNFRIRANTRYGNLTNFTTSDDSANDSPSVSTLQQDRVQTNYSVGFFITFPVFDFLNRKNQVELASLEVEQAEYMADFTREEIRQKVIKLYQDLILKQKLLQVRSESLSDGKVNMKMVEKEFRNGVVPISEYVRITSITANLEAQYHKAMSEFIIAKQLLEEVSGFTFDFKN